MLTKLDMVIPVELLGLSDIKIVEINKDPAEKSLFKSIGRGVMGFGEDKDDNRDTTN